MDYEEYEKECEIIRAENADLIQIFKSKERSVSENH